MPGPDAKPRNFLLSTLPEDVRDRLEPDLERVPMRAGDVLCEIDARMRHVYFPTDAILSAMYVMPSGNCTEVAMIGREGMAGATALLGGSPAIVQTTVRSAGHALRLPVPQTLAEFARGGAFMRVVLGYTQLLIGQLVQTAACNRHATLEQRLCRWLLLSLDRMSEGELQITHELIALALGAKREGVTQAAGRLRRRGAIEYHRGHIHVLDRVALERTANECYR